MKKKSYKEKNVSKQHTRTANKTKAMSIEHSLFPFLNKVVGFVRIEMLIFLFKFFFRL